MLRFSKFGCVLLVLSSILVYPVIADDQVKATQDAEPYFAVINGESVPLRIYEAELQAGMRKRFYHGRVPKKELDDYKREVAQKIIDSTLMHQDAVKRGISPNEQEITKKLEAFASGRKKDPYWKKNQEEIKKILRERYEQEDIELQLGEVIKSVKDPEESVLVSYYEKNQSLFTTPEQFHVSLIMLKVDPSSSADVWKKAEDEAKDLVKRLRAGADFVELARIHSGDESAANGGDMGFQHKGMLAKPAQMIIDLMKAGDISEPVLLLQGIAIFRLVEKKESVVNPLSVVRDRAISLFKREKAEEQWQEYLADLRKSNDVKLADKGLE